MVSDRVSDKLADMSRAVTQRRRPKLAATVDPVLLDTVDEYVEKTPGMDRSKVIDEALRLWRARLLEREIEEQHRADPGVDPQEWATWKSLQRAAAAQQLRRSRG